MSALWCFKKMHQPEKGLAVYLAPFGPSCVGKVRILPESIVEWELRTLVAVDARYRHTRVIVISRDSLD